MKNKLYKIGEVAKMFNISVSSLRYYESIGLLLPEKIDNDSGYRYYSIKQFEILNTIKYLRTLDMPIDKIIDFLNNKEPKKLENLLLEQKALIDKKKKELALIEEKIDNRLHSIKSAINSTLNKIALKAFPPRKIALAKEVLTPTDYLDLEESLRKLVSGSTEPVIFLGKVGLGISEERLKNQDWKSYDNIFILLDDNDKFEGKTEIIPAETCATVRFRGTHKDAPKYYKELIYYINKNNYSIKGFAKEITMIDNGLSIDENKFVTEIQIPIRRNDDEI